MPVEVHLRADLCRWMAYRSTVSAEWDRGEPANFITHFVREEGVEVAPRRRRVWGSA
jgi:hypothetical protein